MTDEIFDMMEHFNGSFINRFGEVIISKRGNVYFRAADCENKEDIICKLLEWCSKPIAKGEPYCTERRNQEWRSSLLCGFNNYLKTNFTPNDMYWIYDKLGNGINHDLTLKFIKSGFDMGTFKESEAKQ